MNKLFIVPSNIFTFSFENHRPAQAVILFCKKTDCCSKRLGFSLQQSVFLLRFYLIGIQEMIVIIIGIAGQLLAQLLQPHLLCQRRRAGKQVGAQSQLVALKGNA